MLSICHCSRNEGRIHLLYLEQWLRFNGICHYRFNLERPPRRFCELVRSIKRHRGFLEGLLSSGLPSVMAFLCCLALVARARTAEAAAAAAMGVHRPHHACVPALHRVQCLGGSCLPIQPFSSRNVLREVKHSSNLRTQRAICVAYLILTVGNPVA